MLMTGGSLPQRSFVKSMEDRKEEKDAQAFRDDVDYFLSKDEFNIHDFHERVMVSTAPPLSSTAVNCPNSITLIYLCLAWSEKQVNLEGHDLG